MTPESREPIGLYIVDIYYILIIVFTQQSARLQCHTARVNILDQLTEHIWFELLNDQGLMLLT